ncbi:Holliday junction branch migration protein RuvA [Mesomycoplasma moatsii]|uniref:Holliday junction branch migration protein RuvA n=1 Tax=Mesomycoplasma moatsii TaxID=171287 RepID=UPI0003B5A92F
MLYKLGKVISKTKSSLIFESNYTGYAIVVTNVDRFEIDKFQKVFIFDYKNDYGRTYYGFKEFRERIFFEDLLTIPGIGPKTAMSILSSNWKEVMDMIAAGDYDGLAKIPYVGLRTARQIVFDFQKKYKTILSKKTESKNKLEVYKTLRTLGFNENQINLVSTKLQDTNDVDQMIENAIEIISHEQQHISKTQ